MDNNFKTSFIPKKPLTGGGPSPKLRRTIGIFGIVSGILFVAVILMAGAVIGYKIYLNKHIDDLRSQTDQAKATFDPVVLDQLERLDTRIETVKSLLSSHLAFSAFFDKLAGITLKNVGYTSFSFSQLNGKVSVSMSGEAASYGTLALQSDQYAAAHSVLSSPVLSNVALQKNGHVTFTIAFNVNSSLVSYRKNAVITNTDAQPAATSTDTASTTSQATTTN